jgi:hypothetical protein
MRQETCQRELIPEIWLLHRETGRLFATTVARYTALDDQRADQFLVFFDVGRALRAKQKYANTRN